MSRGAFDQSDVPTRAVEHLPDALPAGPMPLVVAWYEEAHRRAGQPNPNAMTLATIDPDGRPSARIVLCKGIDAAAGSFLFFTNYTGRKGVALDANPRAALVMHWDHLDRQIRIEGPVAHASAAESDAYFASRPWESRIGAWSSDQSRPVGSRKEMRERVAAAMRRFGLDPANPPRSGDSVHIPRPPHWGGYRLHAERVELWVSDVGRVHDRAEWVRNLSREAGGFTGSAWRSTRLQP